MTGYLQAPVSRSTYPDVGARPDARFVARSMPGDVVYSCATVAAQLALADAVNVGANEPLGADGMVGGRSRRGISLLPRSASAQANRMHPALPTLDNVPFSPQSPVPVMPHGVR